MKTLSDSELLGEYARHNSQEAFAELVQRYVDLVYSTALRQVGGDAHLAQDVAQNVFTALARKARGLLRRQTLSGWLYTSARFAGAEVARTESRRRIREEKYMHEPMHEPASEPDWETVSPMLDAAMGELREKDREAILLRYFENRAFADVGQRLGLNENAARMRVERALDNLRGALARRGLVAGAGLGAAIAANAVQVAPSGLATTLTAGSLAASGAGTFAFLGLLTTAKVKLGLGALALAGATTIGLVAYQQPGTRTVLQQPTVSVAGKSEFAASVQGNNNTAALPSAQPGPPRAQPLESVSLPQTSAPESLLVVGNQSDNVVQFDLATGRWSELARLPKGSGPRGIAVSDAGKLYLSLERGSKNLVELVPGESAPQLKDVSRPIGRYGPGMLVCSKGQIWTAGDTERLIYRVNPATGEVFTPPQFMSPYNIVGFTMDGDTLYAGEYFQRGIARYEVGAEAKPTVRLVTNDMHLDKPVGLAIGHNGNLYVASRLEPAIAEFDLKTGAYVRTLVDLGVGSKEGVYGLVYAPATRRYYISAGSNIYEVDPDGKLLATYNSPALKSANAIALLPAGVHLTMTQPAASGAALLAASKGNPSAAASPTISASPAMTLLKVVPGKLIVTGQPGNRYRLLATTDFVSWEPIASLENTRGTVEFVDPDAPSHDRRFYRLEMLTE
jgi:RNA polymerase sigma factor (sigma-70 family)